MSIYYVIMIVTSIDLSCYHTLLRKKWSPLVVSEALAVVLTDSKNAGSSF